MCWFLAYAGGVRDKSNTRPRKYMYTKASGAATQWIR